MNRLPIPADFFGEEPPQRIIGTESECNVQIPLGPDRAPKVPIQSYIAPSVFAKAGYKRLLDSVYSTGSFLSNGARVYIDVGHIEVNTAESLGPRQAAASDAAAVILVKNLVEASGLPHNGVHRHSGTIIKGSERTTGYHENFMFPRSIADSSLIDTVMAGHLSSRIWSTSGAVGSAFQLSQKVKGIGDPPITRSVERRTTHGKKPMAMIPPASADADTVGNDAWARLEVRYADAGFSPTAQYLGFAATSLVLRLIEHKQIANMRKLIGSSFANPAAAAASFNNDLRFTNVADTRDGSRISALDYQELLATEVFNMAGKIKLPEDEEAAIGLWFSVIDELRRSDLPNGHYGNLLGLLDFAPRHRYLTTRFNEQNLHSNNHRAAEANLTWDRIVPTGGGATYWASTPSPYVSQEQIDSLLINPPPTRAARRVAIMKSEQAGATSAKWSSVDTRYGRILLTNSYATG